MSEKEVQELKWVLCSRNECKGKVALVSDRGYVDIKRRSNSPSDGITVRVIGRDFSVLANCHNRFCDKLTTVTVENGKLKTEGLNLKDKDPRA